MPPYWMSPRATVFEFHGYSFIYLMKRNATILDVVNPSNGICITWFQFYLFNVTQCRHIGRCHTEKQYLVSMVTVLFNVQECRHIECLPLQQYLVTMVTVLFI
jgi:hypothetical protein